MEKSSNKTNKLLLVLVIVLCIVVLVETTLLCSTLLVKKDVPKEELNKEIVDKEVKDIDDITFGINNNFDYFCNRIILKVRKWKFLQKD